MGMVRAYIGLGSNLGDPAGQLRSALRALAALPETRLAARSSLYRSAPLGPVDQPDYVNGVAALETFLTPLALLERLNAIEAAQGRVRDGQRWGPRTLDLDLLLYGDERIDSPRLSLPHPGLGQRDFVLVPLYEIAPDLTLPWGEPLKERVAACGGGGLRLLEGPEPSEGQQGV